MLQPISLWSISHMGGLPPITQRSRFEICRRRLGGLGETGLWIGLFRGPVTWYTVICSCFVTLLTTSRQMDHQRFPGTKTTSEDYTYTVIHLLESFSTFSRMLDLKQLMSDPTRITHTSESCIDLVLVSDKEKITQSGVIKIGVSDY